MEIKCNVCGNVFIPLIENHYVSRDVGKTGLVAVLQSNDEEKLYDTFDCPYCGCQTIAQERKRPFTGIGCCDSEYTEDEKDDILLQLDEENSDDFNSDDFNSDEDFLMT